MILIFVFPSVVNVRPQLFLSLRINANPLCDDSGVLTNGESRLVDQPYAQKKKNRRLSCTN